MTKLIIILFTNVLFHLNHLQYEKFIRSVLIITFHLLILNKKAKYEHSSEA